jgi:aspartate carbamoyltransferase catalytic subunit
MAKTLPPLRHLISINDLSNIEIERIFASASRYLKQLSNPATPYRVSRSLKVASGRVLATLFYEPSTRTRLSFESAMLRLGGRTISSADPATSSAAKGESLADTVRVVSSYADAIVIRHPRDGAARLAAEYAEIPVINGGDGSHEHPTQTLCDLFTLQREKGTLKDLNVVISGDLKGSRTIHSFVYALARFSAEIRLMPGGKGMELPHHVDWRLRNEFHSHPLPKESYAAGNADIDALYRTADQPHQLALLTTPRKQVDIFYMTRFQKERWPEAARNYLKIDSKFLKDSRYKHASVLHPLPRVGELDAELDALPRAAYFRQSSYGVPIRMALIAGILDLTKSPSLERFNGGFATEQFALHHQARELGLTCVNANCIVHDANEGPYAGNKFHIVQKDGLRLRCFYCETDIENPVVASKKARSFEEPIFISRSALKDKVFFLNESDARNAGFKAARKIRGMAR